MFSKFPRLPLPPASVDRDVPSFLAEIGTGLQVLEQCPVSACLGDRVRVGGRTCSPQSGRWDRTHSSVLVSEGPHGPLWVRADRTVGPDL